jgi:predicted DCC family thiol-disulfide oxidoreductase YuxK
MRECDVRSPVALTILYDATCALCVRCRAWLESQRSYVPLRFLPCASPEAREAYGEVPWLGEELVVVGDSGEVWAGPAAFLVALWSLVEWREWAYRISSPELAPLAERFFQAISGNRKTMASLLRADPCEDDSCNVPSRHRARAAYR